VVSITPEWGVIPVRAGLPRVFAVASEVPLSNKAAATAMYADLVMLLLCCRSRPILASFAERAGLLFHQIARAFLPRSRASALRHLCFEGPYKSSLLSKRCPVQSRRGPVIPENYIRTDSRGSAESAHDPTRCAWS
jgi:hypothetical protein